MIQDLLPLIEKRFKLDWHGDHGIRHWERVALRGAKLASLEPSVDTTVVKLFAYLHDSCREDEGKDRLHSKRAQSFIEQLWRDGMLDITPDQFDVLCFAVKWHNVSAVNTSNMTVKVCWDSDRLDLWRVGTKPDPERMLTVNGSAWARIITREED